MFAKRSQANTVSGSLYSEDMVVFVTGATAGFGEAVVRRFLAAGAKVVGTGRRQERLQAMHSEFGPSFLPLDFDVKKRSHV